MRRIIISLGLTAWLSAGPAHAFEIEAEQDFGLSPGAPIEVLSNADIEAMAAVLTDFAARHPTRRVHYVQASSAEIQRAIRDEGARFDLVISSAMDLQMKLANDGFAASVELDVPGLPDWARWRDQLWGMALEPVVTLASRRGFGDLPLPRSRRELIATLRENPDRFAGRIASYDPEVSGVGYFLVSQDDQGSDGFWRLAEVMGRLDARLFCCSGDMIEELRAGRVALAYNVVASYAARFRPDDPDLVQLELDDYVLAILRSAFVPVAAPDPEGGELLLAHLLSPWSQGIIADSAGVALIPGTGPAPGPSLRPIRLDAGLLVYDDRLRRASLLSEWRAALIQDMPAGETPTTPEAP
ncbi:substrate-binding domain-containing protein [Paracoccus sp. PARArs4]|uniref:ABC transporter substrate-binding protein n=1 Tax=Paracoccus sp. PARArs4 TaxID=2853442 RepID=UPI0024A72BEE|nr:substrate-binding domain-containing protein [Paracoccus sp. PARArs4]